MKKLIAYLCLVGVFAYESNLYGMDKTAGEQEKSTEPPATLFQTQLSDNLKVPVTESQIIEFVTEKVKNQELEVPMIGDEPEVKILWVRGDEYNSNTEGYYDPLVIGMRVNGLGIVVKSSINRAQLEKKGNDRLFQLCRNAGFDPLSPQNISKQTKINFCPTLCWKTLFLHPDVEIPKFFNDNSNLPSWWIVRNQRKREKLQGAFSLQAMYEAPGSTFHDWLLSNVLYCLDKVAEKQDLENTKTVFSSCPPETLYLVTHRVQMVMYSIGEAIAYLNGRNIYHNDLHANNLFVCYEDKSSQVSITLIDFQEVKSSIKVRDLEKLLFNTGCSYFFGSCRTLDGAFHYNIPVEANTQFTDEYLRSLVDISTECLKALASGYKAQASQTGNTNFALTRENFTSCMEIYKQETKASFEELIMGGLYTGTKGQALEFENFIEQKCQEVKNEYEPLLSKAKNLPDGQRKTQTAKQ